MNGPHRPRKRFGQHFLVDDFVIDGILSAVGASAGDHVLEIGPGPGALTTGLVASGAHVEAIEIDRDLAADLTARYAGQPRFRLHQGDVLTFDFADLAARAPRWLVVGNLPYNISTPLILRLLEASGMFERLVIMVQREVAERLEAGPGCHAYGRLGLAVQRRAVVSRVLEVPPECFDPPPRVDSTVLSLVPRPGDFDTGFEAWLSDLVRLAFSARRKTLANALRGHVAPAQLEACGIAPGQRAEEVPLDAYVRLAELTRR